MSGSARWYQPILRMLAEEGVRYLLPGLLALLVSAGTAIFGMLEGTSLAVLIPATVFAFGAVIWTVNQLFVFLNRPRLQSALGIERVHSEPARFPIDGKIVQAVGVAFQFRNFTPREVRYEVVEMSFFLMKEDRTARRECLEASGPKTGVIAPFTPEGYWLPGTVIEDIKTETKIIGEFFIRVKFGHKRLNHSLEHRGRIFVTRQDDGSFSTNTVRA